MFFTKTSNNIGAVDRRRMTTGIAMRRLMEFPAASIAREAAR